MWQNFFISWLLFLSVIFRPPDVKNVEFLPFWGTFWPFWRTSLLNWKEKIKQKSCTWPLRTWWNFFISWILFLSYIFWPPGVKKVDFLHISAILEDFLTEMEKKWIKWKRCASLIPNWNVASVFSFSLRKDFKMLKNWQKSRQK